MKTLWLIESVICGWILLFAVLVAIFAHHYEPLVAWVLVVPPLVFAAWAGDRWGA